MIRTTLMKVDRTVIMVDNIFRKVNTERVGPDIEVIDYSSRLQVF